MKKKVITILLFAFTCIVNSQNKKTDYENTFLNVNHSKTLSEYYIKKEDINIFKTKQGNFFVTDLDNLINPYRGNDEYLLFNNLNFENKKAYFKLSGQLHHIILNKDEPYDIYEIVKILDDHFKTHTYVEEVYIWETKSIEVWVGIDDDKTVYILSKPKDK